MLSVNGVDLFGRDDYEYPRIKERNFEFGILFSIAGLIILKFSTIKNKSCLLSLLFALVFFSLLFYLRYG